MIFTFWSSNSVKVYSLILTMPNTPTSELTSLLIVLDVLWGPVYSTTITLSSFTSMQIRWWVYKLDPDFHFHFLVFFLLGRMLARWFPFCTFFSDAFTSSVLNWSWYFLNNFFWTRRGWLSSSEKSGLDNAVGMSAVEAVCESPWKERSHMKCFASIWSGDFPTHYARTKTEFH